MIIIIKRPNWQAMVICKCTIKDQTQRLKKNKCNKSKNKLYVRWPLQTDKKNNVSAGAILLSHGLHAVMMAE